MAKKRKPSAGAQRLSLWQLGAICLIAGPLANIFLGIIWPLNPPLTNEQRGQALGRGLASLLFVVAGIVMIVVHIIRRNRNR